MSKVTFKEILKIKPDTPENIVLDYKKFKIKVKNTLTDIEKIAFVDFVIANSFDNLELKPINMKIAMEIAFAKIFVVHDEDNGIDFSTFDDTDMFSFYNVIKNLDLKNKALSIDPSNNIHCALRELENIIAQLIDFEKQKICAKMSYSIESETIMTNLNNFLNKSISLADNIAILVEKNGDKINKYISPDILEKNNKEV